MTLADIKNSIFRRTQTNATTFTAADMVLALNSADEEIQSWVRKCVDNFHTTSWTTSDLSTGTAVPKIDSNFHDLYSLIPSYQRAVERNLPSAAGFFNDIQRKRMELEEFYGMRNYTVFTVTIASPGVITAPSHGLLVGDRVTFVTSGALPTGLSAETYYYVVSTSFTSDAFTVSATKDGTAINTSGSQSGTHWFATPKNKRMTVGVHDTR